MFLVCARHSSRGFTCITWNSLESYEVVVIIISILQKRNSLRKVRLLIQGHLATYLVTEIESNQGLPYPKATETSL